MCIRDRAEGAGVEIVMEQVKKAKLTGQIKIIETDQGSYEAKAAVSYTHLDVYKRQRIRSRS